MQRPSDYNPVFFPNVSAELQCFEIPGGDKVAQALKFQIECTCPLGKLTVTRQI